MKHVLWVLLASLLLSCGSAGSSEEDTTVADEDAGTEQADSILNDIFDLPEETLPEPDTNPVAIKPGTYTWVDGSNKVSFAINGSTVILLESAFNCSGDGGCSVATEISKKTCNQAFEKGYTATISGNSFAINSIKTTDVLTAVLTGEESVAFKYELMPPVQCCEKVFFATANWASSEDCAGFDVKDCDPYSDAECAAEENCIFGSADDVPICVPAGDKEVGEECAAQVQCSDGVCMGLADIEGQHCFKYCKTDSDCDYDKQCLGLEGKTWSVCSLSADEYEACNLLAQNCTKPGQACYFTSSSTNFPICMDEGDGGMSDPCQSSTDCQKGFDCHAAGKCYKLCNMSGSEPSCESPFATCPAFYPAQNAGYCYD